MQFRQHKLSLEQICLFQATEKRKHFQATGKTCPILPNKQINISVSEKDKSKNIRK